jgi:hypothetical protein
MAGSGGCSSQRMKNTTLSPVLSAMMCDGMGWFSDTDYKRALLTFDEIYYLLPENVVGFKDDFGKRHSLYFSFSGQGPLSFKKYYYTPESRTTDIILDAANYDLQNMEFQRVINSIPGFDRRYTWSVVNSDGDLLGGKSISLSMSQEELAHAILLNKFLIAASSARCIPITGKPYIHGLISEKYRFSLQKLRESKPELVPSALQEKIIKYNPVIDKIVSVLVPDTELKNRTETEIMEFKERNRRLFERFSYTTTKLVEQVSSVPSEGNFSAQVDELITTEVWKEKADVEDEIRSAWKAVFRSAVKGIVGGLIGVGVSPFLDLGAITYASVIAASIAVTPWVVSEYLKFVESEEKIHKHGLYYLMKFAK